MSILNGIEPKRVMKYFEDICSIPHGSGNTGKLADYCEKFAEEHSLECIRDEAGNIIIKKPRSEDCASDETVIIQGHLDMVCAKSGNREIDFENEGLKLVTDGDFIWADGTTLGGDDGIAVAMALAVLESDSITHPALECVFTVDEEVGMGGASVLDMDQLSGDMLLNIDSEDEGIFTVSCAGGAVVNIELPITRYSADRNERGKTYKINVHGLTGGHSGTEIDKGRENACILICRLLTSLDQHTQYELVSLSGGEKDNAIARSACAVIEVSDQASFNEAYKTVVSDYIMRCGLAEPGLKIECDEYETDMQPIYSADKANILKTLCGMPNGVRKMSSEIKDLVETSSNMGVMQTDEESVRVVISVRSSVAEEKERLIDEICLMVSGIGKYSVEGDYPAWEYKEDSRLREIAREVYVKQYGSEPEISAIHAGLECGIFCGKKEGLDCISFGPDIIDIHTPDEKLDIKSTERVYSFLVGLLAEL